MRTLFGEKIIDGCKIFFVQRKDNFFFDITSITFFITIQSQIFVKTLIQTQIFEKQKGSKNVTRINIFVLTYLHVLTHFNTGILENRAFR